MLSRFSAVYGGKGQPVSRQKNKKSILEDITMMKNPAKILFSALLVMFAAGCSSCCAEDATPSQCNTNPPAQCSKDCNCPVLMVVGEDQEQCGDCTVCTVWCGAYRPCMNAVAACPAQNRKALKDAPPCKDCKEKIVQCAKQRENCAVCGKDKTACTVCKEKLSKEKVCKLMNKKSMKANMNCKACSAAAKQDAVKNAKLPGNNDGSGAVLVVEEDVVTVAPVPEAEAAPAAK